MTFERPNIAAMQGYVSGEQPRDRDAIKLNTNENPYPPSPAVQAVIDGFSSELLRRYPQPTADGFRARAAALHGVDVANLIATRGGDELLRLIITTFVDPGEPIGMTDPTYSLYPVLAGIQGCPTVSVPLDDDWAIDERFAERVNDAGCKVTFVVNPNAPTGRLTNVQQLSKLAAGIRGLLVIDEAYVDFTDGSYDAVPLVRRHDNVILLRSLSKGYGLAGLRFGYGIGPATLIEPMLHKTRDSYNLDVLSQLIAEAAISDQAYAAGTWDRVRRDRDLLRAELGRLGLPSPPSDTNFLLVTVPAATGWHAADLYAALKQQDILVRYFATDRLRDKLRITIGRPEENARLVAALSGLFARSA